MAAGKPLSKAYDAIVIGSGVIGSSISLELSRAGLKTLTIDRNPTAGYGTTSFSSGVIRAYYSTLDACKLAWEAYQYWGDWASHVGQPSGQDRLVFVENGGLMLHTPLSSTMLDKTEQFALQLSMPVERWDRQKIAAETGWTTNRYGPPKLADDPTFGQPDGQHHVNYGLYFPKTGYINDPQYASALLKQGSERLGGEFLFRHRVTRINVRAGRAHGVTVLSSDGETRTVESPVIVNAAGPHSSLVNKLAFDANGITNDSRLTTRPLRVEVAFLPLRGKASRVLSSADPDVGIYWRPEPGNRRILVGGLESDCDPRQYLDDPDEVLKDGTLGELVWNTLACRASLRIPTAMIPNASSGVVSSYDVTEDWMPIYDKSALPGYYQAIGTSGNQFKCAPVVGKLMAKIINDEAAGLDHDQTPVHFDLPRIGQTLNTAHFSRLRDVQLTTSSVMS